MRDRGDCDLDLDLLSFFDDLYLDDFLSRSRDDDDDDDEVEEEDDERFFRFFLRFE